MGTQGSPVKSYDYLLKFLLVGDSDVGKGEILESLQDGAAESPYAYSNGIDYKTTTILLDGRRVKLELWDTSGQGRFCTIFRSYSRGAQVRPAVLPVPLSRGTTHISVLSDPTCVTLSKEVLMFGHQASTRLPSELGASVIRGYQVLMSPLSVPTLCPH
uniref:small monomeric GTPase n=1 Tax=Rousettus aegyptiacus TaxID=9407 RepID=A0A7J8F2Q5_ROUAE|nr:RAB40C, member RAS oncogene family [Rousettus aegyptiacus]